MAAPPRRSPRLVAAFAWYVRRYLRRHFTAVRLALGSPAPALALALAPRPAEAAGAADDGGATIVVLNHPSWWDPLTALVLGQRLFPGRAHYAPIDAGALARYPMLGRLGLFGIEAGSYAGAARFLRSAAAIARDPEAVLWVTAEGAFRDVRSRPVVLACGAAHVARRVRTGGRFLPLALEYAFWDERLPEALACVGQPIPFESLPLDRPAETTRILGARLEETLDRLADAARSRDPGRFETVLAGRAGVGGVYDLWRRARAVIAGVRFEPAHRVAAP